jgi:hypothetical protein
MLDACKQQAQVRPRQTICGKGICIGHAGALTNDDYHSWALSPHCGVCPHGSCSGRCVLGQSPHPIRRHCVAPSRLPSSTTALNSCANTGPKYLAGREGRPNCGTCSSDCALLLPPFPACKALVPGWPLAHHLLVFIPHTLQSGCGASLLCSHANAAASCRRSARDNVAIRQNHTRKVQTCISTQHQSRSTSDPEQSLQLIAETLQTIGLQFSM